MPGRRRRWPWFVLPVLLVIAAVVAMPPAAERIGLTLPWADRACPTTVVQLSVATEVKQPVTSILAPLQGRSLADGHCLHAVVTAQAPADIVSAAAVLPPDRAPQIWIPDSSLWTRQVARWQLGREGSVASSPLLIATSASAITTLRWESRAPTWAEGLSGVRPVAMPNLQGDAAGLLSIISLWQSLGKGQVAEQAVAAAVLAVTRSTAPTMQVALDAAVRNDPAAPLLTTSEAAVFATNRGASTPRLVAVYPRDGSPSLDYPIERVAADEQSASDTIAINTVLAALQAPGAQPIIRRAGFRDAGGVGPAGSGVRSAAVTALALPTAAETTAFLTRLQQLEVPSRILTVMDVSLSMRALVPGTPLSRVALAGRAAIAAGDLLSDRSSAGLWVFALNMNKALPYVVVSPVAPLGATAGGLSHRTQLNQQLAGLGNHLTGGGTALYVTALDAMRAMQASFDPNAVNSVVLFTDGTNENDPTLTLAQVVAQLRQLHNPDKPVRLIAIGIGPSADLTTLQAMVAPTGGHAYRAETADQLRQVLFDSLARR